MLRYHDVILLVEDVHHKAGRNNNGRGVQVDVRRGVVRVRNQDTTSQDMWHLMKPPAPISPKTFGLAYLYSVNPCQPVTVATVPVPSAAAVTTSSSSSAASLTISSTTGELGDPDDGGGAAKANGGKKRDPGADDFTPCRPESLAAPAAMQAATDAEKPEAQSSPGAGYGLPSGVPKRPPTPRAHVRAAIRADDEVFDERLPAPRSSPSLCLRDRPPNPAGCGTDDVGDGES